MWFFQLSTSSSSRVIYLHQKFAGQKNKWKQNIQISKTGCPQPIGTKGFFILGAKVSKKAPSCTRKLLIEALIDVSFRCFVFPYFLLEEKMPNDGNKTQHGSILKNLTAKICNSPNLTESLRNLAESLPRDPSVPASHQLNEPGSINSLYWGWSSNL